MQNRKLGAGIAVGALIVAIVLFAVLSGDDSSSSSDSTSQSSASQGGKTSVPVINIKDGQAVGGVQDLTFNKGDDIRFDVHSDAAYEIHFHGYNVAQDVPAGGVTKFDVPGDADGVYEVEIEDTATQIAEITVEP